MCIKGSSYSNAIAGLTFSITCSVRFSTFNGAKIKRAWNKLNRVMILGKMNKIKGFLGNNFLLVPERLIL